MTTPAIVTQPAEARQIARVLEFDSTTAPHINWDSIATTARQLGAHFEARYGQTGACTITMFWAYTAADLPWRADPTR
jgi:hypothetical protein